MPGITPQKDVRCAVRVPRTGIGGYAYGFRPESVCIASYAEGGSGGVDLGPQRRDVGQVSVALGVVQSVADDELVRDVEAYVPHRHLHLDRVRLAQQRADLERGRLPAAEVLDQPGEGQPGVDDVLEHEDVAPGDVAVEVLED